MTPRKARDTRSMADDHSFLPVDKLVGLYGFEDPVPLQVDTGEKNLQVLFLKQLVSYC